MVSAPCMSDRDSLVLGLPTHPGRVQAPVPLTLSDHPHGHLMAGREHLAYRHRSWDVRTPQQRVLAWLRDHVHPEIPRAYYTAVLGHDLHVSSYAELYVRQFFPEMRDPLTDRLGMWLDFGRVSCGKVTTAFRNFEALNLVTDSTLYGDFKWHEVGLSNAAELNTHTTLQTTTGIARASGTQTNPTVNTYQTIATVTADTTETWQEHGVFNIATLGTMLDRSLISPAANVRPGDTVEFTYILSKNAEA